MRVFDLSALPPTPPFGDDEAAPLTLPSFIPEIRHEGILQYAIRSALGPEAPRVEVDWRGALYKNSARMLNNVSIRVGSSSVAVVARVIDPDLDLQGVFSEPVLGQFRHLFVSCSLPAKNVRLSRLRYLKAGVVDHLEDAYAALVPAYRLDKEAWSHAATVCRVLHDPAECVEVANSLVAMQLEGLAPDRVLDALKAGVVLRQLNTMPMRELVALLGVLAGWDVEKTQRVFPEGASAEAARAELVERSVLVGERLSGWASWLYDHERMRGLLGPTLPSQSRRVPPWDEALKDVFETLGLPYELHGQAQDARMLLSDARMNTRTGALDRVRWELDRADEMTRTARGKLAAEKLVAVARLRWDEWQQDDYENVVGLYRDALECDPECVDALAELGKIMWEIYKNTDEGEQLLREAVRLSPNHVQALIDLGTLLRQKSRSSETMTHELQTAETYLRRARDLAPENREAMIELARVRGLFGDYEEAERILRELLLIWPSDADAWRALGQVLSFERRDYAKAEQCFQTAITFAPYSKPTHSSLALLLHCRLGRAQEALSHYQHVCAFPGPDPEPNLLANYGGLLLALDDQSDAGEGAYLLMRAERSLLDERKDELYDVLQLELSFYYYAHQFTPAQLLQYLGRGVYNRLTQEAPDRLLPPLQAIHKLLLAGVRSPGFNLTPNVEAARRAGHPHADRVALLARIITEDAPLSLMDGQWDEPDAAPSEPPA